ELTVRSSTVVGAQWHAYHLYDLFALLLLDGIIYDTGGAGILAYNFRTGPGSIHIRNQKVSRFSQGGIVVVGDAKPVTIEGCTASYGAVAGILLAGVGTADVAGCRVVGIHGVDIAGVRQYGDGLMLLGCEAVHVARSKFLLCERAGILAYQSAGELQHTECLADVFGLAILEDSEVLFGEDCHFKGGEQDIYNYGSANLAVPNEATPIPDRPE
ncbi:MAG: right-handed parallel beta-helix repeat-containing protein, partial [Lentisphaeria bacterium]|nr:right-handed parallel beta-helix repeat-containing protein [Lentisphaeria bacterium]